MTLPGFTAEESLYPTSGSYRCGMAPGLTRGGVLPAGPFAPPQIHVPYLRGDAGQGRLTVKGENFRAGALVGVRIDNCSAFPHFQTVFTTQRLEYCRRTGPCF